MRLLQNLEVYPLYLSALHSHGRFPSYDAITDRLLEDRYFAVHLLSPVLERDPAARLTVASDVIAQRQWADERGMSPKATSYDILLAQIEDHRTEVFYNIDPVRFPSDFVKRLPGCVRHKIAWRAAPHKDADLSDYDAVISNFPSMRREYEQLGWRTAEFYPAIDPVMGEYARPYDARAIDLLFVGTYSRKHVERARTLESISAMADKVGIKIRLIESRFTRLANSVLGIVGPLTKYRYPAGIRALAEPPVFGRDLYRDLGNARIVFNGAIDVSGNDRGNMRCFETMGCGSLLFTDRGRYPPGMVDGETMVCYPSLDEVRSELGRLLDDGDRSARIAEAGQAAVNRHYSKAENWQAFERLVASL